MITLFYKITPFQFILIILKLKFYFTIEHFETVPLLKESLDLIMSHMKI